MPPSLNTNQVTGLVKTPSGSIEQPMIIENHDGTVGVRYDPKEEGTHELQVAFSKRTSERLFVYHAAQLHFSLFPMIG